MRFASIVVCLFVTALAGAADMVGTARAAAEKNSKAVISIRAVVLMKQSFGGQTQDQESKAEITGVVIDPSGLTVTSASALDPSAIVAQMFSAMGAGAEGMKVEAEVKDAMLVLPDGTEIPADVVMKDTELDLAFIRPRDQSKKFDAVTLQARAKPAQMLDDVFVIGRMSKLANRATSLTLGMVKAVVKGPREMLMPIVRAVEDVIEIAGQAKNAKAPAKPEAAAKPEVKK